MSPNTPHILPVPAERSSIIDSQGVLARIANGELSHVRLDIGCGPSKLDRAVGIDALPYDGVDLVGDVFDVLAVLPDQSVEHVHSKHFFEHVSDLPRLVEEVGRVLKVGGTAYIIVPHFSNPYYYSDPTHRTPFGLYTFCYYARADAMFRRRVPTYQRQLLFALSKIELCFQTTKGQYVRSALKKSLTRLVNISAYSQELYEEMFCYILPCHELRYTLTRI